MNKPLYLVLNLNEFSKTVSSISGLPLSWPKSPRYFCPVFTSKKEALKWADGNKELVKEITELD